VLIAALMALTLGADGGAEVALAKAAPRAQLLIANDTAVFDKWLAAKPAERAAVKGLTDKVKINERSVVAIVLDGYELPHSRKVELVADIVIVDSTGRTVLEKASVANGRTFDPKTQTAVLLKPTGSLIYGVTDPEGVYTVKLTVWDQIRGEASRAVSTFTVSR
jgi:hypothetical protein